MDFHLKQWREQHNQESEEEQRQEQPSPSPAKMPRLLHPDEENHQATALPLFVSDQTNSSSKITTNHTDPTSKFPQNQRSGLVGGFFSVAQWQELELQALIFRHMVAGATIPPELLQLVKRSLLDSPAYYLHNYSYYQPAWLQTGTMGYWGNRAGTMDAEPGRCRRTDGKKWRCSRDVVPGQKYCERHVHRGRNRSRKPVEFPISSNDPSSAGLVNFGGGSGGGGGVGGTFRSSSSSLSSAFAATTSTISTTLEGGGEAHFAVSGPAAGSDVFHHNQGMSDRSNLLCSEQRTGDDGKSGGRVLRHFFDDWLPPRSIQEAANSSSNNTTTTTGNSGPATSSTCLSIVTPGNNSSLDFLQLSTGNRGGDGVGDGEEISTRLLHQHHQQPQEQENQLRDAGMNWNRVMGGPLGEALRSSTGSSPTSVLPHQLPRSISDTSYVSA